MPEEFANDERAALIVLMLENRDVRNRELTEELKVKLSKQGRERLNEMGLLQSWKEKNGILHRITDEGIAWCMEDLAAGGPPTRSGPLSRAHFAVLKLFIRYHQRRNTLAEVIRSGGDLESVIRAAYQALSVKPQDWVGLARLRPELNGANRDEVDSTLLEMFKNGEIHLVPESNRKALTEADHAAAIRIGSEDKHLMAIEES
ncbi:MULTISPECIES: hypothetical protein [Saccharothrix]|uniref:hypothetical protein n=1 Tax=Saccharothrix TaxID=2071 RepID=UPI00093D8E14|nr:hypothetical protein [Saccharothrix sp. CB00851]OKI33047.1 hypothetical protein A6A25_04330 [Saccharothrix sp. CB00851]